MDLADIDAGISCLCGAVSVYRRLIPCNREQEKHKFFTALSLGNKYDPVFRYAKKSLDGEIRELKGLRAFLSEKEHLHNIFIRKLSLLESEIRLFLSSDDDFTGISGEIYGFPDLECVNTAQNILHDEITSSASTAMESVTPEEMLNVMRKELESRGLDWKCYLSSEIMPKITVSAGERTIYINSKVSYLPEEIGRLIVHEIHTHVYRAVNGYLQPYRIFAEGLPGYNETEEGLAIFCEQRAGCLEKDIRQKRLYAARALCVHLALEKGFYEVFNCMLDFFPPEIAYRLVERVKRGICNTSLAGCLTRDHHYISGWLKVDRYFAKGGDPVVLYSGKIGLEDVDWVADALGKGELAYPEQLPDWCSGRAN